MARRLLVGILLFALLSLIGCGGGASVSGISASTRGKWTILVYMNAANDLDIYSTVNVLQMQQVASNPSVKFVVQWKQATSVSSTATFNGTRRYLVNDNQSGNITSQLVQDMGPGIDMGIPQTLDNFVAWGTAAYPADHIAVVVWDHGNGWLPKKLPGGVSAQGSAVSYDYETGHAIQTWQLNQAFQGQHVDIIAFDASLMQMDEVAYQLQSYASFIVGSEESPPGPGYPYQLVFKEFSDNPTGTPKTLSKAFVDGMINYSAYNDQKIEQSVIDTSQMPAVATAAQGLAQALVANAPGIAPIVPGLRTSVQSYLQTVDRYYYDSIDLCNQMSAGTSIPAVQAACQNYVAAAQNAIVWEGHNSLSPGSHGISIDFSPSSYFTTVSTDYALLAWQPATGWGNYLAIAP